MISEEKHKELEREIIRNIFLLFMLAFVVVIMNTETRIYDYQGSAFVGFGMILIVLVLVGSISASHKRKAQMKRVFQVLKANLSRHRE